jgi:hypothetical protein
MAATATSQLPMGQNVCFASPTLSVPVLDCHCILHTHFLLCGTVLVEKMAVWWALINSSEKYKKTDWGAYKSKLRAVSTAYTQRQLCVSV